jgi:hypothetical protein
MLAYCLILLCQLSMLKSKSTSDDFKLESNS